MTPGTLVLIYALAVSVALIIALASQLVKYVSAFRETATKLWNVTADRDSLFIANQGLRAKLGKVSTLKPEGVE